MADVITITGGVSPLSVTNLAWSDEFVGRVRRQSARRTLDGGLHVRELPLSGGRPLTLSGKQWPTRAVIKQLRADADAGGERVLTLYDGRAFAVTWTDDPIKAEALDDGLAAPDDATLYELTELRFLILRTL